MSFQPNSNSMNNYMKLFIQYCLMKNRKTYLENLGYNTAMINNMYNMMNNNMINNRNTTFMMNNMNNNCMNNMNMNTCMMNNMNNMNNTCMMNNMNNNCMMNNMNNNCMMNNMNNNCMNNMNNNCMNNMNMNTCMMNNMNNNCMNNMNMNTCMMNNMNNNCMNNMNMNTCMMNNNCMNMNTCMMNNNCMNNMNMNTCMMNNTNNNCMDNNRRFSMLNCMNNNNYLNMMNNNFMNNLGNTWSNSDFKNNFNFNNNVDDLSNSFNNLNLNNTVNLSHVWNNPLSFSFNNINNPLMNASIFNINSITNNKTNEEETDGNNEILNKDSEITLKFTFMGSQTYLVKCKLNEKFCDVLERFKNEQCPDHFKKSLSVALNGGNKIDPEKSLYESGIKNNSIVLFIVDPEDLNEEDKKDDETDKGEYKLTDEEMEIIRKWREEFDAMNFIKKIFKKNNDSIDDFLEFVRNKELQQVQVKEHNHKLVYLLSNYDWTCSKCKKAYEKKDAKFYCSICNYNLCEECHSKEKYDKKKVFPEGVKPSNKSVNIKFLETDYHEHRLIYCRSSRSAIGYNSWNCDNCRETNENDVWSFYCTNCDFDLCTKCAGFN